eukprot:12431512-Karenia_brevis.AAC.1
MSSKNLDDVTAAQWAAWLTRKAVELRARHKNLWLRVADFSRNALTEKGIDIVLRALLERWPTLRVFKAFANRISASAPIVELLQMGNVLEVHLSHNLLGAAAMSEIILAAQRSGYPKNGSCPLWLRMEQNHCRGGRELTSLLGAACRCVCVVDNKSICSPARCMRKSHAPAVHLTYINLDGAYLPAYNKFATPFKTGTLQQRSCPQVCVGKLRSSCCWAISPQPAIEEDDLSFPPLTAITRTAAPQVARIEAAAIDKSQNDTEATSELLTCGSVPSLSSYLSACTPAQVCYNDSARIAPSKAYEKSVNPWLPLPKNECIGLANKDAATTGSLLSVTEPYDAEAAGYLTISQGQQVQMVSIFPERGYPQDAWCLYVYVRAKSGAAGWVPWKFCEVAEVL